VARRRRGRPKGAVVTLERDRQRFAIAAWWGFRECGCGPYVAAYWAAVATGTEPIRLEEVEGLLTVAGIDIRRTASSLDSHLDALARKAKRAPADDWLRMSALAIRAVVLAARTSDVATYCGMVDVLIGLGWSDVLARLSGRIMEVANSNRPPFEGKLGRRGRELFDRLRRAPRPKSKAPP
jgi:hypothetical protein